MILAAVENHKVFTTMEPNQSRMSEYLNYLGLLGQLVLLWYIE
jgi:hypothetical protein